MKPFALAKAVALVALGIALEAGFLLEIGTPPSGRGAQARAAAAAAAVRPGAAAEAALARCRAAHPGDAVPHC
ncbi:MAG TPA: hypothetical protein VLU43_09050 [Anaeromyxobacteraceae bacterium]|nr:hypothetical protein [Anaeromyxobacteraceae bacterium]